ncbi:hypothetical protein [Staphylococcus carnosus]|uniref:hypothetical protein n=2 Tax=Staphylococcus carnosus TaxID=1281 RepID=UPI0003073FBB|nr:hypothetical protein [Staphylococcus carnosus]GEP75957.1 hypothetical protein SCA04_02710 [Staphylococcus carnosus]GEP79274.1 hypothetical protein SCA05_10670 [Staphylococcus carnosus]SUL91236.1 membrane protein [Staphylococcus carnosus]SUM07728.1 membrane protein [Staphylococcus carnosus]
MYFILAIFTLISSSVSLVYSIQACVTTRNTNAYYTLARSFPIFLLSVCTLINYNNTFLITISIIMIAVHFFDSIVGYIEKDKFKTYGPSLTSVINLVLLFLFIF